MADVPVGLGHWILAVLPIVVLLVFLVPLRWRAPEAAPMAMFTVAIVSLVAFKTSWHRYIADGSWKRSLDRNIAPSGYSLPSPPTPGAF